MLQATCNTLHTTHLILHATHYMLDDALKVQHATCYTIYSKCDTMYATCHTLHVTCYLTLLSQGKLSYLPGAVRDLLRRQQLLPEQRTSGQGQLVRQSGMVQVWYCIVQSGMVVGLASSGIFWLRLLCSFYYLHSEDLVQQFIGELASLLHFSFGLIAF